MRPYDPKKSVWVPTESHDFKEGLLESDDGTKAVVMLGHEGGGPSQGDDETWESQCEYGKIGRPADDRRLRRLIIGMTGSLTTAGEEMLH